MQGRSRLKIWMPLAAAVVLAGCSAGDPPPPAAIAPDSGAHPGAPAVILMIGDGMGRGHLDAASIYKHGAKGKLFLQQLENQGEIATGSLTGITDSAAAGTAMSCGVPTFNEQVGTGPGGERLTNYFELARDRGWSTGVVTTTSVTHATPATFSAHVLSRDSELEIAGQQAHFSNLDVMLGGGAGFFRPAGRDSERADDGLIPILEEKGYSVVWDRDGLVSAAPTAGRLAGFFAGEHMSYMSERDPGSGEPELETMAMAALQVLSRNPEGFVLMIEGGMIDKGAHLNDIEKVVHETVAFDEAVEAVASWARGRSGTTLLVTADHETGGLEVLSRPPAGTIPEVSWIRKNHTNARVGIRGFGPGSERFHHEVRNHRWIHALARWRIEGGEFRQPPVVPVPDGELGDLRHVAALQEIEEMPGEIFLNSLRLDAGPAGLSIGIEGLPPRHRNAAVILIDADYPAGTGLASTGGSIQETEGRLDRILATLRLDGSAFEGFGADFALAEVGGVNARIVQSKSRSGLRAFAPSGASTYRLEWLGAAVNFGDPVTPAWMSDQDRPRGMESLVPWTSLYPAQGGGVPPGATLALAAFFADGEGLRIYNQALPHFPPGVAPVQTGNLPVPGLIVFNVDPDGDGRPGGEKAPELIRPEGWPSP